MSQEHGVTVINGSTPALDTDASSQRSTSPNSVTSAKDPAAPRTKRFLNGWTKEQEKLMAEWSDIAACYRWIHDRSEKVFHSKNLSISLPVIILSTLTGTANFGLQSIFGDNENAKRFASFGIGTVSLLAGILTTVGNYLRYAQLEESHRVAGIAWGKFQRLVAVELALHPNERMDSLDFLKVCRNELDRLIEQSPPIPTSVIKTFEKQFGHITDLKKPDVCGEIEHTHVFKSNESRLKQLATDAALMLRKKKQMLNELVLPEIQEKINREIEERLQKKIEAKKRELEELDELEKKRREELEAVNVTQVPKIINIKSSFESRIVNNSYQQRSTSNTRSDSRGRVHRTSLADRNGGRIHETSFEEMQQRMGSSIDSPREGDEGDGDDAIILISK
jgi:hypothetical protein